MIFKNFWNVLWFLVVIPPVLYVCFNVKLRGRVRFSSLNHLKKIQPSPVLKFRRLPVFLRIGALSLFIVALMRPQKGMEETSIHTEGIDIVLGVDVSGSMLAEDFTIGGKRYNRLYVVKNVVQEFIEKRKNDRIGIVVFSGRAYTLCPLTLDHEILLQFLDRAKIGMVEDGTAIGSGIATALNKLNKSSGKSKIIILLTDGINNAGKVSPENATDLARALGVKIYTIGVGSKGPVPYPAQDFFGRQTYQMVNIDINDDSLRQIASATGGKYFRATDTESLEKIYNEIDRLEKTKIEVTNYMQYKECFPPLVLAGIFLILMEALLAGTRLRTLP